MPADVGTGDTYGPLNYLLYVPFVLMFGFSGEWDFLPAAHALTLFSFVAGAMALFITGLQALGQGGGRGDGLRLGGLPLHRVRDQQQHQRHHRRGRRGHRARGGGLAAGAGGQRRGRVRGQALPHRPRSALDLHDGCRTKARSSTSSSAGPASCCSRSGSSCSTGTPSRGCELFYEKTLAFQGDRVSPWTIYTQVPALAFLQKPLTAFAIFLAFLVAFVPRKRTMRRLAALSAALVIAFQLTVNYWFYAYVIWFEPFVFVSLLLATNEKTALDGASGSGIRHQEDEGEERGEHDGREHGQ